MDENLGYSPFPAIKDEKKSRRHSIIGLASFDLPVLRKRKRKDDDNISIQSFDSNSSTLSRKKSRRSLLKVSSLANILSPTRTLKKATETLKRSSSSSSFKIPTSPIPKHHIAPYKAPEPSPTKRRLSRTWSDMMEGNIPSKMNNRYVKRQEAIYELYQGEIDLVEDLNIVKKTYRDSMEKLQLLSKGELDQIFGSIDILIPIHKELEQKLQLHRMPDGTTEDVGLVLKEWVPNLKHYVDFCANQVFGKAMLDEKKNDPSVEDFLQRCQESPFSRKLDLWSLLDGARAKFIKYPLLIKSIQKYTDDLDDDLDCLEDAIKLAENLIAEADRKTGEAKCRYFRARINLLYEDEECAALEDAKTLVCNGTLKNNKGSKLHIFLFDTVLVVTRLVNQGGQQRFQVYRQPIPTKHLIMEDLKDGEMKTGSFRKTFGGGQNLKNILRISFDENEKGQSHTLVASDEHDKRQWMQCINSVIKKQQQKTSDSTTNE